MDELRKNHILQITLEDKTPVEGIVLDYSKDRVMVLVDEEFQDNAKKIKELDTLSVVAHTVFGLKKMNSSVISELDGRNCIVIENNPTVKSIQRRKHVRAVDNFDFQIQTINNKLYCASCVNISAGGIAFHSAKDILNCGDKVKLIFETDIFLKKMELMSEIIKAQDDFYVAKYDNLNDYDESRVVKRVFKLLAQK